MLGVGGFIAGEEDTSLALLSILIAVGAAALAVGAFVIRRRRAAPGKSPGPRGTLEVVATLVAIIGGVAGLAVQFIPGLGVDEEPAPEASMAVRAVNARVRLGEYAKKTGLERPLSRLDRSEVGNVIWLEIKLAGYRDTQPWLQYGVYDPNAEGALLPKTDRRVRVPVEDMDTQTSFEPIWVGYPKSERFQVQFRLLEDNLVRQVASTGTMRGSRYRYTCPSP